MKKIANYLLPLLLFVACETPVQEPTLTTLLNEVPSLAGNDEYLPSPFVTAGDRLYMVGHQDGTFPDHGWHVAGEMGGIWDHPIKLMDGFLIGIATEEAPDVQVLDQATSFINYPVANKHLFALAEKQLTVERIQFVPDQMEGIVVELALTNQANKEQVVTVDFLALVDLTPVWLAEKLNLEDAEDEITVAEDYLWAKDKKNDWFTAWSADAEIIDTAIGKAPYSPNRKGNGSDAKMQSRIAIPANGSTSIRYFIAGSDKSKDEALSTLRSLESGHMELLQRKISRYDAIAEATKIDIPDERLTAMYEWTKYNTDWLMRDVEGLGRGLAAGMADYPWWFGADNCYSLQGLLATGQHEEVFATIDLIVKLSKDASGESGRIMHEASTNGVVFNPGNLNETPHFIYLLWKVFEWTGDTAFLRKHYDLAKAGFDWIKEQDHDGNGYADGPGMMEIPGLHTEMIDVVVYTQQAAWALSQISEALELVAEATEYAAIAQDLKEKINTEWWSEASGSFADFRASRSKTLELIDAAIIRSDTIDKPWAVEELKQTRSKVANVRDEQVRSQVVYHNWVVNTPMEMNIADPGKAQLALKEGRKYRSQYGSYVTGLDRDESQGASSKWEVFSYVGAVMTLPTGVQAMAEANYGNTDEAYEYLKQLTNSFSYALPGSTYEVSPDYGMMAQAWNIYAVAVPIVTKLFGIEPQAHLRQVRLSPSMPTGWDNVSIGNVKVGDNQISLTKRTDGSEVTFEIAQTGDWELLFYPPERMTVKADQTTHEVNEEGYVKLTDTTNTITLVAQ